MTVDLRELRKDIFRSKRKARLRRPLSAPSLKSMVTLTGVRFHHPNLPGGRKYPMSFGEDGNIAEALVAMWEGLDEEEASTTGVFGAPPNQGKDV